MSYRCMLFAFVRRGTGENMEISSRSQVPRHFRFLLAIPAAILISMTAIAGEVGSFTVINGLVDTLREAARTPIVAQVGMGTYMQDIIRTKHRSRTQLKFIDNSMLNMGQDYMVEIKEYIFDADKKVRSGVLHCLRGSMRAMVAKVGPGIKSRFEVETPTAIAAARGTDYIVNVISELVTEIVVLEGSVTVRNIDPAVSGEVVITAGQRVLVMLGSPPNRPENISSTYLQLLINTTNPDGTTPTETGLAEIVPIPPPPAPDPLPTGQGIPDFTQPPSLGTGVPPVTPPSTETLPSLLSSPPQRPNPNPYP